MKKEKGRRKQSKGKRSGKRVREIDEKLIELLPVVEYAIYEVDKIFESQGDRLTDEYLVLSLNELVDEIKEKGFERLLNDFRGDLTEDYDVIHWNIVSRLGDYIESSELKFSDSEIVNVVENLIDTIKLQMSNSNPRAYLSFLAEIMKGAKISGFGAMGRPETFGSRFDDDFDDDSDEERNWW